MTYNFKCEGCGKVFELEIPMSEYSKIKDNQFCSDCGDKLERIIEWDGPTNLCTSCYGVRDYKSNWTTGGKKK